MRRLTRHYQDWEVEMAKPNKDYITTDYFCPRRDISYDDCLNKLGLLEDIEAKLGIGFMTLIKILKDGIYDKQGEYYYPHLEYIDDEYRKEWILIEEQGDNRPNLWFHFKDYGKTWALTKEELE